MGVMKKLTQDILHQFEILLKNIRTTLLSVSDEEFLKPIGKFPLWKHMYHCLHSMDQWLINPFDYTEPDFHVENLKSLVTGSEKILYKSDLVKYFAGVASKAVDYLSKLSDDELIEKPENCKYDRLSLINGQMRHASYHIGFIQMGIYAATGRWIDFTGMDTAVDINEIIG